MGAPQGVGDNIISSDVVVGMTAVVVKWWVWGYFFDMGFFGCGVGELENFSYLCTLVHVAAMRRNCGAGLCAIGCW